MPRWGYAIVAALIVLLAAYTLWPAHGAEGVAVFPARITEPFTVTGALGEQRVEGGRVKVGGLDRAAEKNAVTAFAGIATALRVTADQVVEGIDAQAARAWGIDGQRRLTVGDAERQWGQADGTAAVWDPRSRRVFLVRPEELQRVVQSAARLDARGLIELPPPEQPITWLRLDDVRLTRIEGSWRFPGDLRPRASGRVERLLTALRSVQLSSLAGAPPEAAPIRTISLPGVAGIEEQLRVLRLEQRVWLERAGTPAQELAPGEAAFWLDALAALDEDRLLDPPSAPPLSAVIVSRSGGEVFRLVRRETSDADGGKPWEVRWPDGAEPAAKDAGERIQQALLGLAIERASAALEPLWAGAATIELLPENGAPMRVVLDDSRAWADGWSATVRRMPAVLRDLRPDATFDVRPLAIDAERIIKLQRRWPGQPARDEVLARASGGSWARTFPASTTPADPLAVGRLARSLVRLTGKSVRHASAAEKIAEASAELAVRVAPQKIALTGVDDELQLEDTIPQEHLWRLSPAGDEAWLMVDPIGGLAFTIDPADAEALLADVASTRLFPVAPSLIAAVEVAGASSFRLSRAGAGWNLRRDGRDAPADAIAARRLLRALTALDASGTAPAFSGASIAIVVETGDGERLVARVRQHDGSVLATSERGTVSLDPAAWAQVALDPAAYAAP